MIRALTPALIGDYFDFFDHRAFPKGSPFAPCYCNAYNMSAVQIREKLFERARMYGGRTGWKRALRESAWEMVCSGQIQGYLAYDGAQAIGWCNANDRMNYYRVGAFSLNALPPDRRPVGCTERGTVKSVVCFEIAPEYRGMGIAGKLLARVCEDAASDGYAIAEAYPQEYVQDAATAFTGPLSLYEKAGFAEYARRDGTIIMRKALRT
jgi:GNAT superfamily N-acetyltransferase